MTTADTKKPRRARADSRTSAVTAMQAAGRVIQPPADIFMDARERVIFDEIAAEFPKVELTEHQLRLAALLAKEMSACAEAQGILREEGSVLTNSRGNRVLNPRARIVQQHTAAILSMRRSLALHARAKEGGDNRLIARHREIQKGNEQLLDDQEDLLAKPNLH